MSRQNNTFELSPDASAQRIKQHSDCFYVDGLMEEIQAYAGQKLQNDGKSEVGIEILIFSDFKNLRIQSDRKCLRQIFTILLDNAVKYTDSGYIFIGYHTSSGSNLNFFIEDTGRGILINSDYDLTIASGLVQLMGGSMEIRPAGYAGTAISFNITCQKIETAENSDEIQDIIR